MGRKIPGRKHHGVRDPEKQRKERLKKIKDKINAPPGDPEEQQVPKSLQRLVDLKEKTKNGDFKRKKTKKPRPKQRFEQHPNEPDHVFMRRVNQECAVVKHEAAFAKKFNVEIKKNADGIVEEVKKLPKDPLLMMIKEARQQKKKKKKVTTEDEPRLTNSQKKRVKSINKKNKVNNNVDEFGKLQDNVKFGEQVHAPPTLTAPKKVLKTDGGAPRPGTKDLLLKSILNKTSNKVIDKTGKRKNLPNALRRQLDKQQLEIIEAYRQVKGRKRDVLE